MTDLLRRNATASLVWVGMAACVIGLLVNRMWAVLPWGRFGESLVLLAAVSAAATLLRWAWRGSAALAQAAVWVALLVYFAGPLPVAAAVLLAFAALALGSLLVPADRSARAVLALPVGLVLIAGSAGWLLPLPIHRWYLEWPLLAGICVLRRHVLFALLSDARRGVRRAIDAAPRSAAFAITVLGLASSAAWLPTLQHDDLSYHLGLPAQLLRYGDYALDPGHQIWALAPWLGDVLQGWAAVLAGHEARGVVDALWLLAAAGAFWRLCAALRADARTAWFGVAIFASLPLLSVLLAGMQTELPASALVLALALAIVDAGGGRLLFAGAVLAGGLVGLKIGSAADALILAGWALLRARGVVAWRQVPLALVLVAACGLSSYVYAGAISGNPFLPVFNQVFHAAAMPATQLDDLRWHAGFGWTLPWTLTFDTARYLEAWSGGFGFALVAGAGAWLLALARPATRGAALSGSLMLFAVMLPMQYARYAFPGLALLVVPLTLAARAGLRARAFGGFAVLICMLDVAFRANAGWVLHAHVFQSFVMSGGQASAVYVRYVPERALLAELRRRDGGDSIVLALDPQRPYIAELGRRGRSVAWYDPTLETACKAADADADGAAWQRLLADNDVRWLLLWPARLTTAQRAGLVRSDAQPVADAGGAALWRLPEAKASPP